MQSRFSDSSLDLALPCFSFEVDGFTMIHLKDMNYFWTESPNLKESFTSLKQHPSQKKPTVFSFFSNSKYISLATLRMFIKSISNPNLISLFCNTWNDTSPKALQLFWIWEFDVWRGDCDWFFFSAKHCFQALVFGKVSTQWGMSFQSMESVVDFSCRCWSSPLVFRGFSFWDIYIIHDW